MKDMNKLNEVLSKYVFNQDHYLINFELAESYYELGYPAAACNYYLRSAELTKDDKFRSKCFIKLSYSYLKQGDRIREVNLMANYAKASDPLNPKSYNVLCILYMNEKNWIGLLNESEIAYKLPLVEGESDEYYLDKSVFKLYHAYALFNLKLFKEQYDICKDILNESNNDIIKSQCVQLIYESGGTPAMNMYTESKLESLRAPFPGIENIKHNYSQAMQDIFVLTLTNGKVDGTYLELGSSYPKLHNNTYLLEQFNWKGLSVDSEKYFIDLFKSERSNDCIVANALDLNYNEILNEAYKVEFIDYLQIDIDTFEHNIELLKKVTSVGKKFGIITFETDYYKHSNDELMNEYRNYMYSLDYKLLVKNVSLYSSMIFEDWWIHNDYLVSNLDKLNISNDINLVKNIFMNN